MTQKFLKNPVIKFCTAVAADTENLVTVVCVEAKVQLANNDRPGDVAGSSKGQDCTIGVFTTRLGSATNNGKFGDTGIEETGAVKRKHQAKNCKDSGVLFFTFGMDAEGRLGDNAEETPRFFTNQLMGESIRSDIFRRHWTRKIAVGVLAQQMRLVLNRQKGRSP